MRGITVFICLGFLYYSNAQLPDRFFEYVPNEQKLLEFKNFKNDSLHFLNNEYERIEFFAQFAYTLRKNDYERESLLILDSIANVYNTQKYKGLHAFILVEYARLLLNVGDVDHYQPYLDSLKNLLAENSFLRGDKYEDKIISIGISVFSDASDYQFANELIKYQLSSAEPLDSMKYYHSYFMMAVNDLNFSSFVTGNDYLDKAYSYFNWTDCDSSILAEWYTMKGFALTEMDSLDNGLEFFNKALSLSSANLIKLYCYSGLARCYYYKNNLDSLSHYSKVLVDFIESRSINTMDAKNGYYYLLLTNFYLKQKPDFYSNKDKLIALLDTSELSNKKKYYHALFMEQMLKSRSPQLIDTYYNYEKQRLKLDEEYNSEILKAYLTKFNTEKKEAENAQLRAEQSLKEATISSQRNLLIGGTAGLALVSLLSFILYKQREKQKKLNREIVSQRDKIQVLNSELNHRVKNNLAFMTSLLEMQERRTEDPQAKKALRESESRMRSLSLLHSSLMNRSDTDTIAIKPYLEKVLDHLIELYNDNTHPLVLDVSISDIAMNAEDAMRLGLIINELVTNSVKHAFDPGKKRLIFLRLKEQKGKIKMRYEDGSGMTVEDLHKAASSDSLGMKLIQLLVKQLDGEYMKVYQGLEMRFSNKRNLAQVG